MAKKVTVQKAVTGTALMVVEQAPAHAEIPANPTKSAAPVDVKPADAKTLYVKLTTMDIKGKVIGERIVDMYHYGTRKWLHDHLWWASHNDHLVEFQQASVTDIEIYLADQRQKLADKFNTPKTAAA